MGIMGGGGGGGGGTLDHAALTTHMNWLGSAHVLSGARKIAASGSSSSAAELTYTAYTATLLDDADAPTARATLGLSSISGDLSGDAASPSVVAVHESGGQKLTLGGIADSTFLQRVGNTLVGVALSLAFASINGSGYDEFPLSEGVAIAFPAFSIVTSDGSDF